MGKIDEIKEALSSLRAYFGVCIALMVAGHLDTVEDYTTDIKYNSDLSKAAKGTSASDDMKGTEDLGPV